MHAILTRPDTSILCGAAMLLAAILACGLLAPPLFWLLLAATVAAGVAFLALRFPTGFCVAWLLLTGMSLEMTLHDLVGAETYQPAIAVVKGIEIGLGFLCALRFGPRLDPLCPVWAFLAILTSGLVHGLYPGLTTADSLRSMIGSAAPFVFCFCRVPRSWAGAIIRATKWCPLLAVAGCVPLTMAGIRPLFIDSGGARLGGLGHPAFLAGVCLPAIYACLIQLFREGRRGDLLLLLANGLILLLTGARAPCACAVGVTGFSLISIRSSTFAPRDRLLLIMAALALLPLLALLAGDLGEVRLFNVVINETGNLSGRGLLWPRFEDAAAQSPWFGWGIGAGNAVIPPDGRIARMLHTWAAHNEYLRIEVEGGVCGEALLVALFTGWVIVHTRELPPSDRRIMRLAFLALAGHAFTDNVLISTPACVMFAFATAVFARGRPGMALPDSRLVA
ncbi:MAG: O-antigen ligase family protein [Rhodopila sp.]|nr:O-antigen ligase family protein [Rhodopila sp.]